MPIAIPEKLEPMTPIKPLSVEEKEAAGEEPVPDIKDDMVKPDGIKVDELDRQHQKIQIQNDGNAEVPPKPFDDIFHPSNVPKPQQVPFTRRRAEPIQFDSLGEVVQRYEAHLLIPIKSYPLINWRTALLGTGEGLQPVTLIERETGAAILIRTMKRSIHRKPAPFGLGGLSGAMSDTSPELKRLEDALLAVQNKIDQPPRQQPVVTNAPPSPDASNMPLPPTPKPDENPNGRLLPNAPDVRLKVATGNSGPVTPAHKSPTMGKDEKVEGEKSTHVMPLGQNRSPPPTKLPLGPVAETPETEEGKAMEVDGKNKGEMQADPSVPLPAAKPELIEEPPKRTGAVGEEIGLHCWVIGILEEEVDMAVEKLQALFDEKIRMFEDWARENEFDPIWFDEETDSEDGDEDDADDVAVGKKEQDKGDIVESKPEPKSDVEMKGPTAEVAAVRA